MLQITSTQHQEQARLLKESFATYRANQDLISVGAYRSGADPLIDRAIASQDTIRQFVRQPLTERLGFDDSVEQLDRVANDMLVTQTVEPASMGMKTTGTQLAQGRGA